MSLQYSSFQAFKQYPVSLKLSIFQPFQILKLIRISFLQILAAEKNSLCVQKLLLLIWKRSNNFSEVPVFEDFSFSLP